MGAALLAVSIAAVAACGSSGQNARPTATNARSSGEGLRHPAYTYQPDVVFVGTAGEAVLGATGDGLVWTIDGDARGASDLAVGTVMYASSQAVGRVLQIDTAGDDLDVTLAPVQLTEVFQDAAFDIDTEVDAADVGFQVIPDLPGMVTALPDDGQSIEVGGDGGPRPGGPLTGVVIGADPTATIDTGGTEPVDGASPTPTSEQAAGFFSSALQPVGLTQPSSFLPPATKGSVKVSAGGYEVEPVITAAKLGLRIGYKALESKDKNVGGGEDVAGLKLFIDVAFSHVKLRMKSTARIEGGVMQEGATVLIEGLSSVSVAIAAGAETAESGKVGNVRVEVPVEITVQIPGEPIVMKLRWAFAVKFVPGGKNSTLKALGEWALDGPIGLLDGTVVGPTLTTTRSIMDSVTGLAPGVAAIIFAAEVKAQFGLGIPAAFAGPYAKITLDLGVVNGSSFGAPYARCVAATLDLWAGGGVGFSLKAEAFKALERLLGEKAKLDLTLFEQLVNVTHREQTLPAVGICTKEV